MNELVTGRRPRIGVTLDSDEAARRYELKRGYVDAVLAAGGLPILLPHGAQSRPRVQS